jgi:hypothetical protein
MLSEGIYKELQHRPVSSAAKSKDVMKSYPIITLSASQNIFSEFSREMA